MKKLILLLSVLFSIGKLLAQCPEVTPSFTVSNMTFCGNVPHSIIINNTSTGADANATQYVWSINGAAVVTTNDLTAPSIPNISGIGLYTIELETTDGPGFCNQTFSLDIEVIPLPSASFTAPNDGDCAGTAFIFINTSSETTGSTTYEWNFGDGGTSTNENPSHTYAFGGTYTITLTVTNAPGCSSTSTTSVSAIESPNVFIAGDDGDGNTTNCLLPGDPTTTQTVAFSNFTTGAVSYFWDFGDGSTSTDFETSHTYTNYGTFPVTMTATGPNGCTSSQTLEVVFERFVSASMTLDITEYSGCLPHTLNSLQNLSVNASQYVWNFGDGTPSITTNSLTPPNHVYSDPGSYTISLTASNNCNTANATISPIQIVGAPVANFNPSVTQGCAPQAVNFTNTSTGASPANNYTWNMGNGNVYNNVITPPAQNYTNQGTYPITVTASNACGSDDYTFNLFVDSIPLAIIDVDPNEGCSPLTVNVDNLSTGNINNYWWYLNGTYHSNAQNIGPFTYTYPPGNSPVTQTISLTVGNQCGTSSDLETVIIHRPTLAQFTASATTVCLGNAISFNNTSLGENLSFEWDFGNGDSSTDQNPGSITYASPGTYTIQLIANGYCGPDTMERIITVNPLTVADFDLLGPNEGCSPLTVEFANNSTGVGLSYNWSLDGVSIGSSENITPITFTESPGNTPVNHVIALTVNSACGNETIQETVIVHRPTEVNFSSSSPEVCDGESFTFTDSSLGEDLTWEWNFGNGITSTDQGPHTITYDTPDNYTVELIVDGYCGRDSMELDVLVNPVTIIDISTPDPIEGCAPLTINLENNSSGTDLTYTWTIDGNFYSNDTVPGPITFDLLPSNNAVDYEIMLEIIGLCGTENMAVTATVHPPNMASFVASPSEVCLGDVITVEDNSLGENLSWNYDFGNGVTASTAGPHDIEYLGSGTYLIELVVEGFCENDTLTQEVTVYPYPIAAIQPNELDGCQELEMTFTNNSSVGATYNWNFGTNAFPTTSTNYDPGTITFPLAGTEMITLAIEENGCTSFDTTYIDVYPLPQIDFDLLPNAGCNPLQVSITNNSPDNGTETFFWNFGNGNTSSEYSPSDEFFIALSNDSIYDIKLVVTSGLGCSDSLQQQVIVNPLPIAEFAFEAPEICLNESLILINQSIGASTYTWDFGDGTTSNAFSPTHSYASAGTYTVELTVETVFGCSDIISYDVVVNPIPEAVFSNTTECFGYATEFTDLSVGTLVSWNWNFGDGNVSTDQSPAHMFGLSGNYDVQLTVTNNLGCRDSINNTVLVNTVPVPDFSSISFCLGDATSFTNLTSGSTIGYEWNFGDGSLLSTAENPNHIFASTGDYSVQLVAFGGAGCSDTIVRTISITEVPISNFDFTDVCANDTTFFNDLTLGSPDNYLWDFGNGQTSTDVNPFVVYSNDGSYTVSLTTTYTSSGCNHTYTSTVTSFPRTQPNFSATTSCLNDTTYFTDGTTGNPVLWEWDFGDGTGSSLDETPAYVYSNYGLFTVQLITENSFGCRDTVSSAVEVYPLPVANFDFDTVCLNQVTTIIDTSTDAIDWQYNWDDGTVTNAVQSPTNTYINDGSYEVEQVVTNLFGCTDTLFQTIIVRPNPSAQWVADTACFSYETSFTNLSVNDVSWTWDFGDNGTASNLEEPSYTFSSDGVFTVSLTVENIYGCTNNLTADILVLPQPVAQFENNNVCAGSEVLFINTSQGSPIEFSWNFGDGSQQSTIENPIHTYTTGGFYDITFIVNNSAGCADTLVESIEVYSIPQIAFTADTVCLFSITSFDNNTTDIVPISEWFWDFGDGNTSFQENPTYIYQTPGVFDVTLQVTNVNGCDSSIVVPVYVSEIPTANFDADVVCFGSPTTFTDLSTGNPTQWIWSFGDGTVVDGGPVEQHTYSSPGNYVVSLVVIGGGGVCNDQTFQIIAVDEEATAQMIIPAEVCEGSTFNFQDNSIANNGVIDTYLWDMGDGTIYNTPNGTHQYGSAGDYNVTLTVTTQDGCSNSTSELITINANPTADFTATLACQGQTTQFTNLSAGALTSWVWNFGDGNGSLQENPTQTYLNSGTYNVTLVITNVEGCSSSTNQSIDVFSTPNAAFNSTTVCWGDVTNFINQSTIAFGSIDQYVWTFGDNEATSNQTNPIHTFEEYNDNFNVELVAISNNGCTDTVEQNVNLHPIVNFDFSPNSAAGCQPVELAFTDNSATSGNASIVSWNWDFGDGFYSFNQNPTHVYNNEGDYTITLTVVTSTDCQFTMQMPYNVTIYPKPIAGFSVDPTVTSIAFPHIQVSDESVGAIDWEYYFDDGNYSNLSNPYHTYDEVGVYRIMQIVKSGYGCIDTAYQVAEITELFTFFAPNSFTPNGDGMNDQFEWAVQGTDIFDLRIFNRWGEVIYRTFEQDGYWDGSYNGELVQDGVYIWQVELMDMNGEWRKFRGHITVLR